MKTLTFAALVPALILIPPLAAGTAPMPWVQPGGL